MEECEHTNEELPTVKVINRETGEEEWVCADCLEDMIQKGEADDTAQNREMIAKLRHYDLT
ncbi:hypothetical protein ES703_53474 [subsurface metagenome]